VRLPFNLTLASRPRMTLCLRTGVYTCASGNLVATGAWPEQAWAEWFALRFPGSPHVATVRALADDAFYGSSYLAKRRLVREFIRAT
jgi:hypothetical protein